MQEHDHFNRFAPYEPQGGIGSLILEGVWNVDEGRRYDVRTSPRSDHQVILVRTLEGTGRLSFKDGAVVDVGPGTALLFRYRECSRYRCWGARWRFWWFACRPTAELRLPFRRVMPVTVHDDERDDLQRCRDLLLSAQPSAVELASRELLARMASYVHRFECSEEQPRAGTSPVQRAIGLMQQNLGGITVAQIAAHVCLGERRFRQVFRAATGLSPKRYYDRLRLAYAAELLTGTTQSVAQIADQLGFSSAFHLSRAFAARFGVAPSRYRAR
ncbi:MAG: helix-turn-helix domain-containing protein [Chitinivibrionales bacterium]|nr:helix-turn-helix domain-containing protein [Chitinivibrionales bacterium]